MDKIIETPLFSNIKNKNKQKIKQCLEEIKEYKDIPIISLSDDILVKILESIFIKNEILSPYLYCSNDTKIDNYNKPYITDCETYERIQHIFISPGNIFSCIDIFISGCEKYLNVIENPNTQLRINSIENKIIKIQNSFRKHNRIMFVQTYSHFLLLKECANTIRFDLYNEFNHIYLETLYFKYNMLQFENLEQLLLNIKKIEQEYLKLKIPFSFEIENRVLVFDINNINDVLNIIDINIENYHLKIIQNK